MLLHIAAWLFSIGMFVLGADVVSGQDYPNRPIHIVATVPGSAADSTARLIAQGISVPLGQPVIVDNRPAALLREIVSRAPPDGHTVLLSGSTIWIEPLIRGDVSWDSARDLLPLTLATTTPLIVIVHPSLPVKSVKELIALAKARPGELNFGSGAAGSASHLGPELFKAVAGVNIVRVPYQGAAPALTALIAGEVQLMIANAGSAMPHVSSGRLKALAVTSAQPSALFPGLPTVAATGLPGYEAASPNGMFVPPKTPAAIIKRLNLEIVRVLNQSDVKQKLFNAGVEPVGSSPEQLAAAIKSDITRLRRVIKDAGIREE